MTLEGGGTSPPAAARSRRLPAAMPGGFWLKLAVAAAIVVAVVVAVPPTGSGRVPSVQLLTLVGACVSVVMTALIVFTLRYDFGLPSTVVVTTVAFNLLVLLVKFVLSPYGIYEVNQRAPFEDPLGILNVAKPIGTMLAAGLTFALYGGVLFFIYWFFKKRVAPAEPARPRRLSRANAAALVLGGAFMMAFGGGAILLLFLFSGLDYLQILFSSTAAALVLASIVAATILAVWTFRSVAELATTAGDITVLVSFFWMALYLLAIFHVLWVVYVIALASLFPLRVVVPK